MESEIFNSSTTQLRYATFGRRFVAFLLDVIILTVFLMPVAFILLGDRMKNEAGLDVNAFIESLGPNLRVFLGIGSVIQWIYFATMESSDKQATLGKRALGLIVTDTQGKRISLTRASVRYLGKIISSLAFYVGYLLAAFTKKRQALHDLIAETVVVVK